MRRRARAALAAALPLLLAACALTPALRPAAPEAPPAKPDLVLVRPFTVPQGVVALDPNFGFSLRRGRPGVPQAVRAASVGRAAAYVLAETAAAAMRSAGLPAVRAPQGAPARRKSLLVVGGVFSLVDEGVHRGARRPSRVVAEATVEFETPGSPPRQLLAVHADSSRIPERSAAAAPDLDADAAAAGRVVAEAIVDLARRANWAR